MKKTNIAVLGICLFTLLALIIDVFGSDSKSVRLLGIHSEILVIPTLLIAIIYRVKISRFIREKVLLALLLLVIGLMIAASLLAIAESVTPPNVVYSITRLHPLRLIVTAIFSGLLFFINQSDRWWIKHRYIFIFSLPLIFFYILYLISLLPFNIFKEIVKEDQIIEYLQFFVLLIGSVISLKHGWLVRKTKNKLLSAFLLVSAVGFFLIAGDEISWGQRLLGIETPESIRVANRQEEITFHNLHIIEWAVSFVYIGLSFFGAFAHFLASQIKVFNPLKRYLPSKYLFGYFVLPLIFFTAQRLVENGIWHPWSEVSELYLYTGLVLWVVSLKPETKTA